MAKLPTRLAREAEYERIADAQQIIVSSQAGNCQRDALLAATAMYENFKGAMRSNFVETRPAMPVLYLDATGGCL
eukprot:5346664-Pleurochrysis_carterae.AAC.1